MAPGLPPMGSEAALDIIDALLAQAIKPRGLALYAVGGRRPSMARLQPTLLRCAPQRG